MALRPKTLGGIDRDRRYSLEARLKIRRALVDYAVEYRKTESAERLANYSLSRDVKKITGQVLTERVINGIIDGSGTGNEQLAVVAFFLAKVKNDPSFLIIGAGFEPSIFYAKSLRECVDYRSDYKNDRDLDGNFTLDCKNKLRVTMTTLDNNFSKCEVEFLDSAGDTDERTAGLALKRGRCIFSLLLDHDKCRRYFVKIGKVPRAIGEMMQEYRVDVFLVSSAENGYLANYTCTKN